MVTRDNAVPLVETAKALRPRILAERARIETARRLPDDLAQELARAGFFRIFLPAAYGGLDLPPTAAAQVFEELSRRPDASVAWCVWNGNTYWTTARWPKEVGQALFADPNMILANSTRPSGRAEVVEGGYRLSGRWSLVSKCQISARPSRCARPRRCWSRSRAERPFGVRTRSASALCSEPERPRLTRPT
jgi:alkylation response protein AidB-like acyl-CoA dehydrogenase